MTDGDVVAVSEITDVSISELQPGDKTVALVLGSGGARGYTHLGVIDEIERRGYRVVSVTGSSMGAIVGGFYCSGKLEVLRDWALSLNYLEVLKLVDFSLLSSGAIRGDRIFSIISDMLEGQNIEDLPLPFTAVATDISNQKEVWFQNGPVSDAIRASAAIPSLLTPVSSQGRLLVDGGVLNPLPIAPCVSAHADYIIAVDLNNDVPMPVDFEVAPQPTPAEKNDWFNSVVNNAMGKASQWLERFESTEKEKPETLAHENLGKLEILNQMFEVMQASLSQFKTAGYPPDLLISMPSRCCEMYEFYRAEEMIALGRHIAIEALDAFEQGKSSLYGQGVAR